jgi:hypothetical protein
MISVKTAHLFVDLKTATGVKCCFGLKPGGGLFVFYFKHHWPFALNTVRRAGKLRGCEPEFFAAGFSVPRVLRGGGARGVHQRPELCAAGGLGGRERPENFMARAQPDRPDE